MLVRKTGSAATVKVESDYPEDVTLEPKDTTRPLYWVIGILWSVCMFLIGGLFGDWTARATMAGHVEIDGHPVMVERVEGVEEAIVDLKAGVMKNGGKLDALLMRPLQ